MSSVINSVEFVPVEEMSLKDWTILDYFFLRNTAKNRIADLIVAGNLIGFYRVNVLEKASTKPYYYWPATTLLAGEVDEDDPETWDFFGNESEDEFESDSVINIDNLITEINFLTTSELRRLLAMVAVANKESDYDYSDSISDLQEAVEEKRKIRNYEYLLMAIYIYQVLGIDEFREYIDSITSDDVEELFDELRGL